MGSSRNTLLERAFAEHWERLFRAARYLLGNEPDAEDLCQTVFNSTYMASWLAHYGSVVGQNYTGEALGLNYVFVRGDPWRFDTNLRFYHQKDDTGQIQNRLSPSFKVANHWKTVTLECEVGAEDVRNHGPLRQETSTRSYLYLGYRWELR